MKLKLNKKKLKNLSKDNNALPADMTPKIAGGNYTGYTCNASNTCLTTWSEQPNNCNFSYIC